MLRSIDPFLTKQFRTNEYNCLHFTAEVWEALTGQDLRQRLSSLLETAVHSRRAVAPAKLGFTRHDTPVDPCLVIMQAPPAPPHIGVYLRQKILHIHEGGVEFLPLFMAMRSMKTAKFYT